MEADDLEKDWIGIPIKMWTTEKLQTRTNIIHINMIIL